MDVCVLGPQAAGRFEHYGIWPKCRDGSHSHIKWREAQERAERGEVRFLERRGAPRNEKITMVIELREKEWVPCQAHNEDGSEVIGLRVWGNKR